VTVQARRRVAFIAALVVMVGAGRWLLLNASVPQVAAGTWASGVAEAAPVGAVTWPGAGVAGPVAVPVDAPTCGPVVAPESVEMLFRPFRRLHERTGVGGFGLGLAIVAAIAEAHGGTVLASPNGGGGLRVTVTLPAAGEPADGRHLQSGRRAIARASRPASSQPPR